MFCDCRNYHISVVAATEWFYVRVPVMLHQQEVGHFDHIFWRHLLCFPPATQMDVSYRHTETSTVTWDCMLQYTKTVKGTRSILAVSLSDIRLRATAVGLLITLSHRTFCRSHCTCISLTAYLFLVSWTFYRIKHLKVLLMPKKMGVLGSWKRLRNK
jgi:hypothetical protein